MWFHVFLFNSKHIEGVWRQSLITIDKFFVRVIHFLSLLGCGCGRASARVCEKKSMSGIDDRLSTNKLSVISFESLCKVVDLDKGYFLVVFLEQSRRYRRKIAQGTTNNEGSNRELADSVLGRAVDDNQTGARQGGGGGLLAMLGCCFPETFQVAVVRGYTSTLSYYHCEVAFFTRYGAVKNDERSMIAVGVHSEEAFIEARSYGTKMDSYEWVNVGCERDSMIAMLALAIQMRGRRFSMSKMSRSAVSPGPDRSSVMRGGLDEVDEEADAAAGGGDGGGGVFCSELTMKLLSLLPHPVAQLNRPNAQTVDDIMAIVSRPEFHPRVGVTDAPRSLYHKSYGAHTTVKLTAPPTARHQQQQQQPSVNRGSPYVV